MSQVGKGMSMTVSRYTSWTVRTITLVQKLGADLFRPQLKIKVGLQDRNITALLELLCSACTVH